MALKVLIELNETDGGGQRCAAAVGDPHGARWHATIRVEDCGSLVLVSNVARGEERRYLCDPHLYKALQFLHREIEAGHALRGAVGLA